MSNINHDPTIPTRNLLQATLGILQGEMRTWQRDEPTQEELQTIINELDYTTQQLKKRLADPGIRCGCGAQMEQVSANGLHCPHCGFYRRMTDEEYAAIQRQGDIIRASNRRISQPDLEPASQPQGVTCQVVGCKSSNAVHCSQCGAWLCSYHLGLKFHNYDLKQQQGSMYVEPNHLPIWAEE